jgi:hypothetical protein
MRSNPFADRSRRNVRLILVFLIVLEAALAVGLILNNRSSSSKSAVPSPVSTPVRCASEKIINDPRTVVVGNSETFSVCLPILANQLLQYKLTYADGTTDSQSAQADGNGFSSRSFVIKHRPRAGREAVLVTVSDSGVVRQHTRFAIQDPSFK